MKKQYKYLNALYNAIFRIVAFISIFYITTEFLFFIIPYSLVCQYDYLLLAVFVMLILSSYFIVKYIIRLLLKLLK